MCAGHVQLPHDYCGHPTNHSKGDDVYSAKLLLLVLHTTLTHLLMEISITPTEAAYEKRNYATHDINVIQILQCRQPLVKICTSILILQATPTIKTWQNVSVGEIMMKTRITHARSMSIPIPNTHGVIMRPSNGTRFPPTTSFRSI